MKAGWIVAEPGPSDAPRVWTVDLALSAADLARCDAVLSPAEAARAARFLRPADRDRYRASHAALRLILGRALGIAPAAVAFASEARGKPALAGYPSPAFNLSHSGPRALVGVSPYAAIGVDVEALRPIPDALRIARAHFAPAEVAALAAVPPAEREAVFTGLWTRKEAVVKALGDGLSLPLDRFSVTLPPHPARLTTLAQGDVAAWTLIHLEPGPGTVGVVAVRAPAARVALCRLDAAWPERLR